MTVTSTFLTLLFFWLSRPFAKKFVLFIRTIIYFRTESVNVVLCDHLILNSLLLEKSARGPILLLKKVWIAKKLVSLDDVFARVYWCQCVVRIIITLFESQRRNVRVYDVIEELERWLFPLW